MKKSLVLKVFAGLVNAFEGFITKRVFNPTTLKEALAAIEHVAIEIPSNKAT